MPLTDVLGCDTDFWSCDRGVPLEHPPFDYVRPIFIRPGPRARRSQNQYFEMSLFPAWSLS